MRIRPRRLLNATANSLWFLTCLPDSLAFQRAMRRVAQTQRRYLLRLLRRNATTVIGRRYRFADLRSVADYQTQVPLSTYRDYEAAIERIGAGQPDILTNSPVLLFEPTSGSTAATKLIPYTAPLKAEFQRAIAPWVLDLFRHDPRLLAGQTYWSISPVTQSQRRTAGGLPIGFEADNEYFGLVQRTLIRGIMAVPPHVRLIDDMATFRYVTLLFLLRSRNLALMSVWNPTFLTLLVEPLTGWSGRLANDIEQGTLAPPRPLPAPLLANLESWLKPDPRRAAEIQTIFREYNTPADVHARLWPHLRLISCWAEAHAALHVPLIADLFPQARVQGKGLLATEGVVSFPLVSQPGHALALRSHFFEFLPLAGGFDRPLLAHQLAQGEAYEVVLTTGGGLYRYRLGDVVRVVGHVEQCPLLEFVGRAGPVVDRFGEKLNEAHVRQVMATVFGRHALEPAFAMLAYASDPEPPAYTLFIQVDGTLDQLLRQMAVELDLALQENFHYAYCQKLEQLGPLRVFRISEGALAAFHAKCQQEGQRAGDIKPVALHRGEDWAQTFRGRPI